MSSYRKFRLTPSPAKPAKPAKVDAAHCAQSPTLASLATLAGAPSQSQNYDPQSSGFDFSKFSNFSSAPPQILKPAPEAVEAASGGPGSDREPEGIPRPLAASLTELERHCPDHIEAADWQHAVEDGRRFLMQWGEQAAALGWAEADVFGLPPVPSDPHPSWQRLARVDQLGLVWLTHGRPVTSITAESAAIATPSGGSVSFYRLHACQEAQKTSDAGVTGVNDPTRASNAARPSYEVIGGATIGQQCALCNSSIGARVRINYGGQEHTVHRYHADEYVKALAEPQPKAAKPGQAP